MTTTISGTTGVTAPDVKAVSGLFQGDARIVESGSNANGTWIKFADGTLIQRGLTGTVVTNGSMVMGGIYGTAVDGTHPFPVAFYNSDYAISGNGSYWTDWGGWAAPYSTDSLTLFSSRAWSGSPSATCKIQWIAIGRWKA